jgi:transposase
MVGCDLHDHTMLLKLAMDREVPRTRTVRNTVAGRKEMIRLLDQWAQEAEAARVVFAYEASGQGFGLYDELTEAGIECHVLAPTRIARSSQHKKRKTDEQDAQRLLDLLRSHVLAGVSLPAIWIPDAATRDDREVVRTRLELADKLTAVKSQVKGLLKRRGLRRPAATGKGWTATYRRWLAELAAGAALPDGSRGALASLLRQLAFWEQEIDRADEAVRALALSERYRTRFYELLKLKGVGLLTAMVFLTEIGDLRRFANRRQIAAYLGLVPSSSESGARNDRKGRITRQGPYRVRKVLCQAVWSRVRTDEKEEAVYQRLVQKNPKKKKIAVVASMRRLAVRMWHRALDGAPPASARARQKGAAPPAFAIASAPGGG